MRELLFQIERKLKIDDPVGAIAVHGVNGFFGTAAVGVFAEGKGLLDSGSFDFLWVQTLGVSVIAVYSFVCSYAIFMIMKKTIGIRIKRREELAGIDAVEFGVEAYTTFE